MFVIHQHLLGPCQVVLKTSPPDLANVNEWKIMFDPYIVGSRLAQGHKGAPCGV